MGLNIAWGRDPSDTKYGFEDDVSRTRPHFTLQRLTRFFSQIEHWYALSTEDPEHRAPLIFSLIGSYFTGFRNKDVAFFHKESKSLIEADLLMNLPPTEQVRLKLSEFDSIILTPSAVFES